MDLSNATIAQLLIPVDDLNRGIAFYRGILGLPLLFVAPPQMAFFQCGAVRLLVGVAQPGQPALRGSTIYFRVDDIQGIVATLQENRVSFLAQPHVVHRTASTEVWLAEFTDPDGNHLALMSERAVAST